MPPPVTTAPPAAPASNAEAGPSLDPAPAPEEKDQAGTAAAAAAPQDVMSVISRLAAKGVPSVLEAMRERSADSEYQCWCCDALSGLCAGNGAFDAAGCAAGAAGRETRCLLKLIAACNHHVPHPSLAASAVTSFLASPLQRRRASRWRRAAA